MNDEKPPNILLVAWDACRYDYALEHASYLNDLGSSNISFERAVAPSPWSLPSHASIFTGEYPHEHGRNRLGDSVDAKLARVLSERGYKTYGVSANGFASQRTGFHEGFDEFRYTGGRDVYIDGMDVSGTSQDILRDDGKSHKDAVLGVLKQIPGHDHSLKSLANLLAVSCGELATRLKSLQKIPHPVFAPTSDYSYTPDKNTRVIRSILEDHDGEAPFFIFTNYMDTHRCYKPSDELQEKHVGRSMGYKELVRLNEEVAAPWTFEEKKARGELKDSDVEDVRSLYAGEVETVDSHLRKIMKSLEAEDMLDDTLVVVTADHGENLGETDDMGRRRMGHVASVSEAVLRVPLVLANPKLTERTVSESVSLKNLYDLLLNAKDLINSGGDELPSLVRDESTVSQYPATGGGDETIDNHPDVPEEAVRHQASENSSVAYDDGWKVVVESTGKSWVGNEKGDQDISEAPEELMKITEKYLSELQDIGEGMELSDEDVDQLEALGYM